MGEYSVIVSFRCPAGTATEAFAKIEEMLSRYILGFMPKVEAATELIDGRACPHGDDTCPCQDGDICHYEGSDPMFCSFHQTTHRDGRDDASR